MAKQVTMQNIADFLNISKNSVSQAISGKFGVSEETRRKVSEVAKQLGYQYRRALSKNTGGTQGCIGLIASDYVFSEHAFFGTIILSIDKEIKARKYSLLIQAIDSASEKLGVLPTFIGDRMVDGLIVLSELSSVYIQKIIDKGLPTMLIDHHHPSIKTDCILTNNRHGAYNAVEHLIKMGHTKIGFMGNVRFSPSFHERLEGYRLALSEYGLPENSEWIHQSFVESDEGISRNLQKTMNRPTAWFCGNDNIAFILNKSLQNLGYKVPVDVSVCGFDDQPLAEMSNPPLTTMNVDTIYYGKLAVEQLFWRMDHTLEKPREILLSTDLMIRNSVQKISE